MLLSAFWSLEGATHHTLHTRVLRVCGITGYQGPRNDALLSEMSCALAHRGPDGDGSVTIGGSAGTLVTGLAHRRLSIIDLSPQGAQPMAIDCAKCGVHGISDLALVYNGELYNFPALRARLSAAGHSFHSNTDSEVLLHLYAEEGTTMVDRLNGIFCFAIYDGRERGHESGIQRGDVFIARDQLGVKPLYYTELTEHVLFASELKALLRSEAVPRTLDPTAIQQYMTFLWSPGERTMLKSVHKLEPGCALVLRHGRIQRRWRYWEIPFALESFQGSAPELYDSLRQQIEAAVRRQMISDVPVGAFLSGGLDSSTIVAMMRRLEPDAPIRAYCIGSNQNFGGETTDDVPYAKRVAKYLRIDLEVMNVEADVIDRLDEMVYLLDEPQADPAPLNALLISERARADGYKVLLSGAGGDDLFSGYRRHAALAFESSWEWLPHAARTIVARSARRVASGNSRFAATNPTVRRLAKAFSYADLEGDRRLSSYFSWNTPELRRSLFGPLLREEVGDVDPSAPLLASLSRLPGRGTSLDRMLFLEVKHFLADHNLNYTDRMGMAAGVEVRVPLIDLELVEFAARIPSSAKQDGRLGKAVLKRAMEPMLPRDIIYRPKTGFGAPLRHWLRHELRERVEETLSPTSLRRRGLFDERGVRALIDRDRAGSIDGSYTIFSLMCIEIWCRLFVDGVPLERPTRAV